MTAQASPIHDHSSVTDLVRRARGGDQQAWNVLVERYAPLIWSICRAYRLGGADTDDVGQTVWLQLVDQLGKIREPAALPGWLATTTRRECGRTLRAARKSSARYVPDDQKIRDEQAVPAEEELLAAERAAALREAFDDLPPACRRLIALLIEDPPLSYAQISARLGIPVGSIGPSRRRCLDKLRRHPAIAALIDAEPQGGNRARSHGSSVSLRSRTVCPERDRAVSRLAPGRSGGSGLRDLSTPA